MKRLILVACACAAGVAVASDYAWQGGASGAWNTDSNWNPNGVPGAGDTATFSADTEITDDFAVGEGTLTIRNDAGTALSVRGSISGKGGVWKTGAGSLKLYADNPFEGPFTTQGMKPGTDTDSSAVYVYASGALGRGQVSVDPNGGNNGSGGRIYFDPGADGTLTFGNPINVGGASSPERAKLYFLSGNTVLNGEITCIQRPYIGGSTQCQSVRFGGNVNCPGQYFHSPGFGPNTQIHFDGWVKVGTFYTYSDKANIHFSGSGAESSYSFSLWSHLVCDADDTIYTSIRALSFSKGGIIDLNGHDQTFDTMWGNNKVMNYFPSSSEELATTAVTSPVGSPAQMVFTRNCTDNDFRCAFTGAAGVNWQVGGTLTFSNSVSTTRGALTIRSGTICVADGAQFTSLSDVSIANKAKFVLKDTAGGDCYSRELHLYTGGTLAVSNGMKFVTSHLYVDDEEIDGYRTYGAGDLEQLVGAGVLEVIREKNEYVGPDGGEWSDPDNWSLGEVPTADMDVQVVGKSVSLDAETPVLFALTVAADGQLRFTGAGSVLNATTVTVAAGGLVTSEGPFTDEKDASRVRIDCTDLTVAAGGAIDVSSKGWSGSVYENNSSAGYGPGAGRSGYGASHGGRGGRNYLGCNNPFIYLSDLVVYGDAAAPVTCGSGGARISASAGNPVHGGGAVRIVAAGDVVIDGAVRADGGGAMAVAADGIGKGDTGGAGGSVWVTCRTLSGSGTVSAAGGCGSSPIIPISAYAANNTETYLSRPGGGGRVAVDYDAGAQASVTSVPAISAKEGGYLGRTPSVPSRLAIDDQFFTDAEPGTLSFTDETLFYQALGKGLSGKMLGIASVTVDGDLDFEAGHLIFEGEGFTFKVTGDLAISSDDARLEIGQSVLTNKTPFNCKWAGRALNRLEVGGDLSVTDGAALDVRAAEKGTLENFGAEVTVGGAMTIGAESFVYAWCDPVKPIPVKFAVGSLTVSAGGTFSAENRGAAGGWGGTSYGNACLGAGGDNVGKNTYGTGNGTKWGGNAGNGGGGSHGGLGGLSARSNTLYAVGSGSVNPGNEGEDPYAPVHPGAGGSSAGYGTSNPAGGGVIYVLSEGAIRIDGTVTADSSQFSPYSSGDYQYMSGMSAGGSIYLFGDTFASGPTARLTARGADAMIMPTVGGCGGGGCIAVWTGRGNLEDGAYRPRQLKKLGETTTAADLGYQGVFDVSGGTNVFNRAGAAGWLNLRPLAGYTQAEVSHGGAGTIRFATVNPRYGALLIVR